MDGSGARSADLVLVHCDLTIYLPIQEVEDSSKAKRGKFRFESLDVALALLVVQVASAT